MVMTKKELLLEAAKDLFGVYGYSETTFKKISERAGVALGLLTHHFGNKEKLFLASGMDVLEHLIAQLREAVADADSGREAVRRFVQKYFEFSTDPNEHFLVLIRCSPYSDVKTREDREEMAGKFTEVLMILRDSVKRGVEDGSISSSLSIDETAIVLQCNLVGGVRTRLLTPYYPETLYEDIESFIMRGL
ncbi:TetR/AcrR family transcriptional regulator [Desulfobaculum bizertense]|uniref:Transcriptional regulator, TetR family n=1 Tax=Desulfobaculum bizertense DSM 18034 TaxID=1121442 RepID=A0A1T4X4D3_9BACT|nr:TetR/AcrR family transcriptional regulator [Desulfobaculum bizertense]UIJ37552.1 TetR/AcrR family transcriptional regulator [Desulfobaculum bizertense]SKA84484.1 transcriptional regulator, TetR family [Desulfobaculum bizertense DSM 18034]